LHPESFENRVLESLTIDSSEVLLFFTNYYSGYQSLINNIAKATPIIYLKEGLHIVEDSPFYSKYIKQPLSDKVGYDKYILNN